MLWLLKIERELYAKMEERVVIKASCRTVQLQVCDNGVHMKNCGVSVKFSRDHFKDRA